MARIAWPIQPTAALDAHILAYAAAVKRLLRPLDCGVGGTPTQLQKAALPIAATGTSDRIMLHPQALGVIGLAATPTPVGMIAALVRDWSQWGV